MVSIMRSTNRGYHVVLACALVAHLCSWSSATLDTNPIAPSYDQLDINARRVACRQDPTWLSVDYEDCQNLMRWKPRNNLWSKDKGHLSNWLDGRESRIEECLKEAFHSAKEWHEWARQERERIMTHRRFYSCTRN